MVCLFPRFVFVWTVAMSVSAPFSQEFDFLVDKSFYV